MQAICFELSCSEFVHSILLKIYLKVIILSIQIFLNIVLEKNLLSKSKGRAVTPKVIYCVPHTKALRVSYSFLCVVSPQCERIYVNISYKELITFAISPLFCIRKYQILNIYLLITEIRYLICRLWNVRLGIQYFLRRYQFTNQNTPFCLSNESYFYPIVRILL